MLTPSLIRIPPPIPRFILYLLLLITRILRRVFILTIS